MHQSSPVAYFVEGNTNNYPLVLLSGFTGTHGDLLDVARELKDRFFLIIPEFPGWGESPKGDSTFTISDYAKVLEHITQKLGIKQVTLVGHCMGATVALETAYLFPGLVKELFLISPPYQEGTWGQGFFETMAYGSEKMPPILRPLFFFWRSRVLTVPMSFFVLQTRTFHKKLRLILKTLFSQSHQDEHVLETNWNSLIEYDYNRAKKIKIPVHVMHGAKDVLIPVSQAEKLSKLFGNVTLDILPDSGHLPPVETPGEVVRIIKDFKEKELPNV